MGRYNLLKRLSNIPEDHNLNKHNSKHLTPRNLNKFHISFERLISLRERVRMHRTVPNFC
jgi:hypothetical protein